MWGRYFPLLIIMVDEMWTEWKKAGSFTHDDEDVVDKLLEETAGDGLTIN